MRSACLATVLVVAPLAAQTYFIPPTAVPTTGACNVIPFGSSTLATWGNQKYQTKATVADLAALPNLITGLGFAPCGTGTIHFDALEVVLDHHPAGAPLDPTFANNLTPNAVTVLSATDYTWNITANTWNEIGLQNYFVYNGTDDLVIQITNTNGLTTGTTGFHRDARQRLYWFATTGPAAPTGTLGTAAGIVEVGMLMARVSSYGKGCAGSAGTPTHNTAGTPQLTQTISFGLTSGVPSSFAVLVLGFYNGSPPFPMELSAFGMPNCFQYTDTVSIQFAPLDGAGAGAVPFTIPNDGGLISVKFFSQFACIDPAANATGITTSNYNRILIGN